MKVICSTHIISLLFICCLLNMEIVEHKLFYNNYKIKYLIMVLLIWPRIIGIICHFIPNKNEINRWVYHKNWIARVQCVSVYKCFGRFKLNILLYLPFHNSIEFNLCFSTLVTLVLLPLKCISYWILSNNFANENEFDVFFYSDEIY